MDKIEFLKVIDNKKINIYLQPIISLPMENIVGYEALTRGPVKSKFFHAEKLFKTAERYGMAQELETLCIQKAVKIARKIPEKYWIAINIGPELFSDIKFHKLIEWLSKSGLINRIFFELTEHAPFMAIHLLPVVEKLKREGLRLSLDDMGCGFINMETVRILRPEIVKLCITITDAIKMDKETVRKIKGLVREVKGYGGMLLAEGVKRVEQIEVLKNCGASFAQGSYYEQAKPPEEIFEITRHFVK